MDEAIDLPVIRGKYLRYLLVLILDRTRCHMTLPQLTEAVHMAGFTVTGPPGKAISDSLRWACDHRHVKRVDRGIYMTAGLSPQTRHRYKRRLADHHAAIATAPRQTVPDMRPDVPQPQI